jgi:hypothetical protein
MVLISRLLQGLGVAAFAATASQGAAVNSQSLAERASSSDRLVFAHFMVCISTLHAHTQLTSSDRHCWQQTKLCRL